jgi:hypothetical protein
VTPIVFCPWKSSLGTIGSFAPFHSQRIKAIMSTIPTIKVPNTYPLLHGCVYPPDCRATRLNNELVVCLTAIVDSDYTYNSVIPEIERTAPTQSIFFKVAILLSRSSTMYF